LLRLPAEIRNQIFAYALGGQTYELRETAPYGVVTNTTVSENALALLVVCRQLYAETALAPFSLNFFSYTDRFILDLWLDKRPLI
jgi:hypothetical protein